MDSEHARGAPERIWTADTHTRCSVGFDTPSPGYKHPYILATPAALADSPEVQALIETTLAALKDPLVVHLNMVAGKIAKPLPSQLVHIYGEAAIRAAFAEMIAAERERVMRIAASLFPGGYDNNFAKIESAALAAHEQGEGKG